MTGPKQSLRLSWVTRLVSCLGRYFDRLTCTARSTSPTKDDTKASVSCSTSSKCRRKSKKKQKVAPLKSVLPYDGTREYRDYRRKQAKSRGKSRKSLPKTNPLPKRFTSKNSNKSYAAGQEDSLLNLEFGCQQPPLTGRAPNYKVWTTLEILLIFRDNDQLKKYFNFQQKLGSGSFSVVCKAKHKLTREVVAIKIISKKHIKQSDIHRIDREVENMSCIDHPNVVKIFQIIHTPEMAFIIMEYCSGGDLFDKIINQSRMNEEEVKHIFRQVLYAVIHLHKLSIHHRDLKPENILLESQENPDFVKLIDFNLSVHLKNKESLCSTPCGTVDYAAPEIFKCEPYNAAYSESWTLGILLYALLAAEFPFAAETRQEDMKNEYYPIPTHFSPGACDLISRILKYDPEQRLSPSEMLDHPWLKPNDIKVKHSRNEYMIRNRGVCSGEQNTALTVNHCKSVGNISLDEEVVKIIGNLMSKCPIDVRKVIEEQDRTSPIYCTYSMICRKKKLMELREYMSWLNRIQHGGFYMRRSRTSRSLRYQRNEKIETYLAKAKTHRNV